ncbi:UAP1 [Enterospora canceri]|uniref:UDP-N-acetylglucosamine diphosphorylase n=1 Tax=Enterospora canceri TaxID=1081671 RepID=A0A1Y1S9B5_9MICR|nr:UAP1 [Enterospora canceri]
MGSKTIAPFMSTKCHAHTDETDICRWTTVGKEALDNESNGFGVVMMGGGEGSRLGCKGPKGLFVVDRKTNLFDVHMEKLKQLKGRVKALIYLFFMTSAFTREKTEDFVKEFFGTRKVTDYCTDYEIIVQGNMPILDLEGNTIGDFNSPNGNGGVYIPLREAAHFSKCQYFNLFSVDNIAATFFEESILGCMIDQKYDVLNQAVNPNKGEKVGAFTFRDDQSVVIEEYDPSSGMVDTKDVMGNICNHMLTGEFIKSIDVSKMEIHKAEKSPKEGMEGHSKIVKQELFVFDCFDQSNRVGVYCVDRETHFVPLKSEADVKPMKTWFLNSGIFSNKLLED